MEESKDNKCIILTKKEYNALKEEAKRKELYIYWRCNIDGAVSSYSVGGGMEVSSPLYHKIFEITNYITTTVKDRVKKEEEVLRKHAKVLSTNELRQLVADFSNLPWYKRLFFKTKYIKIN